MSKMVIDIITNRIIESLEKGIVPWHQTWKSGFPTSLSTDKVYRGLNLFILSTFDYPSKYWVTANQIRNIGGKIKESEYKNGVPIQFWKFLEEKDEDGNDKTIAIHRFYTVYNVSQCENLPESVLIKINENKENKEILDAETIISNIKNPPKYREHPASAFYRYSEDCIYLPAIGKFDTSEDYYATKFHELIHAIGHETRLNRKSIVNKPDTSDVSYEYSKEELVAESGATMLCGLCNIESTFDNSVNYIKNWLINLKNDRKILISAMADAQKAVDYVIDNNN